MTAVSINSQRVPLRGCGARAGEQPAAGARPLRTSVAPPALPRAEGPPFSSDSDSPFLPQENLRSDKAIKLSGTNKQARICTDAGYTPSNPARRGGNLPSPCPYQPWLQPRGRHVFARACARLRAPIPLRLPLLEVGGGKFWLAPAPAPVPNLHTLPCARAGAAPVINARRNSGCPLG